MARLALRLLTAGVVLCGLTTVGLYAFAGAYGFNVILRRGASVGVTVTADDPRLSASMRLALRDPFGPADAGPFGWQSIAPGFEVAELPVLVGGQEVDRMSLARIDPKNYRFVVRTAPAGNRELDDWMTSLGAALIVNGSYFTRSGVPDTPLMSDGVLLGPAGYVAKHGAFVASAAATRIHDLAQQDWRVALRGADDAMVSFPLLVAADGVNRINADRRWLANRSFVGEDRAGRIVVGTTADAFFSLERLGKFLRAAPLDLAMALNLDGGPVACQGVALNGYRRNICGRWELATRDGQMKLLTPVFGTSRWAMPIVLAVLPR